MSSPSTNSQDTRTRILHAAERLFAERGFAATSLRSLVAEADVNLAAVHYHFGSKEGLIREVFARFIRPVNEERTRRLDALDARDTPATLEELLDAWITPSFEMRSEFGETLVRLMGRVQVDPMPEVEEIVRSQFASFGRRYVQKLSRVLPELTNEEVRWRMHFAIGTLTYTHAFAHRATRGNRPSGPGLGCRPAADDDLDRVRRRLVQFLSAAFRAPASAEGTVMKGDTADAGSDRNSS